LQPTPGRLRDRLRAFAEAVAADAALITGRANVRYLTGFSGSSGWALIRDGELHLLTDERYRTQASEEAPTATIHIGNAGLEVQLAGLLGVAPGELVVDSASLTLADAEELREKVPGLQLRPLKGTVERLRARKDPEEVRAIERALEITEDALLEAFSADVSGRSERELAGRLEFACRRLGADRMSFDTIVAAGSNGAKPHARPGGVVVDSGAPVVVDCGCVVSGYCSDITRAVTVGDLPERWREIHGAIDAARRAAIAAAMPGVPTADVDAAARRVLAEFGLEERFVHSLGHGVGLEVHELPRLSARSDETLEVGMVVTVEPGVYLPGEGGIRLEDLIVIEPDGARRLNRLGTAPLRPTA
jgi:Xaa-Pro aminopeptidase